MSIYKRGGVWWMRFTTPDGRELRESTQTADRRQAQEYHDRKRAEAWRIEKLGEAPRRTWKEAVVRWVEEADKKSLGKDIERLRKLDPLLGNVYLDEMTRAKIDEVAGSLPCSDSTRNRYSAIIRAILRKSEREWLWLERAPAVRMRREPPRRVRWLTHEDADRLLSELPAHLAAMTRFSLATGLREQNVLGLEWSQVDMVRRVAWIHADQAKGGEAIAVPLNTDAVAVIRGQIGRHNRYVFSYRGNRVTRANNTAWDSALDRADIQDFRWHDLRHTWASWHVQAGTPLHVLQELGGWKSYSMVQRYAHLSAGHLAEAAEKLSAQNPVHHAESRVKAVVSH